MRFEEISFEFFVSTRNFFYFHAVYLLFAYIYIHVCVYKRLYSTVSSAGRRRFDALKIVCRRHSGSTTGGVEKNIRNLFV